MVIRRELKQREFKGSPFAGNVVGWLNGEQPEHSGKNTRTSRKRILDLIDCIRETLEEIDKNPGRDLIWFHGKKLGKLISELDCRVSEYTLEPFCDIDCDSTLFIDEAVSGRVPAGESVAAHGVFELLKQGLLDRIRCCVCGRWFFARFAHQRSCSAACRHKVYEQSEEFKANRRIYMRNYYRLKTSGKVK
jgi:hypothetical protein